MKREADVRGPVGEAPELESGGGEGGGGFLSVVARALGFGFGDGDGDVVAASVPARLAITADADAENPALGAVLREMLAEDVIDERMAVMLLLIFERRRGASSPVAAYVDALPGATSFQTPLFYGEDALRGLEGTNLHAAALAQRKQLDLVLREHVRPAGKRLVRAMRAEEKRARREARSEGRGWRFSFARRFSRRRGGETVSGAAISEEEFRWAYACFWSRALALPSETTRAPVLGGGYRARNRLRQPQLREAQRAVARAARICAAENSPAAIATRPRRRSRRSSWCAFAARCPRPARS